MLKRVLLVALAVSAAASAQPSPRRATNIPMILAYPGFFHSRPVLIVGTVSSKPNGDMVVGDDAASLRLVATRSATVPDGLDEVRGEFWDIGRMKPDDSRLSDQMKATFRIDPDAAWPRPGEVTAIVASSVAPTSPPAAPSIRSIVLNPSRYVDQKVTISGQFAGRNLLGDLPDAPGKSRYDFVLRSADAAIWVVNMRPRAKEQGRDIELSLDARIDTGRWVQVSGKMVQARGLQWIDADAGSFSFVKPPTETTAEEEPLVRVAAAPAPEVIFSAPTQDETDVSMNTTVRIQFSRDIDPATLKDHIRAHYLTEQSAERGEPVTPTADFTFQYLPPNRVLEIKFTKPLERFRTIKVDLLEGILGTDAQPLKPWTLSFGIGGS
jgi:Bacterial Ig-like domain